MKTSEIQSLMVLNMMDGMTPRDIKKLLDKFQTAGQAVGAGPDEWRPALGFTLDVLPTVQLQFKQALASAAAELDDAKRHDIQVISIFDPEYPRLLKEIADPPPIIYAWGRTEMWTDSALAVVGSRRCSFYGEKAAKEFAEELSRFGVVTVSGLARGIDSVVHRATVHQGGSTWAVLGSGLLEIYPPENKKLAESIRDRGALISEFPLKTKPLSFNFPRRNRIISGLSQGCLIIEGDLKSGALITGRFALDQGREVFALPGSIYSCLSSGPHHLIKNGAKLVQNVEDIFDELPRLRAEKISGLAGVGENNDLHFNQIYENILSFIQAEPVHKDVLISRLNRGVNEMATILLEMELNGLIKNLPGGLIARK